MSGLAVVGEMIGKAGGVAVGQVVKDAGSAIGDLAKDLRAAITGETVMSEESKIKLAEIADRLEEREQQLVLGQVEINKLEAQNPSTFVSGWRPAIGWVLAASLGCYYLPKYTLAALFWIKACWGAQTLVPYPVGSEDLIELIVAMLGMAGWRTVEKVKDVARVK